MKCPNCHFINSNTRAQCLKCNADLTQLKEQNSEQFKSSQITDKKHKASPLEKQITISKIASKVQKTSSEEEIKKIKHAIGIVKNKRLTNAQSDRAFEENFNIIEQEISDAFIPEYPEKTIDLETESSLSKQIEKKKFPTYNKKYEALSFEEKVIHTREEIGSLITKWQKIYDPKINKDFLDLISSYPNNDIEFEINPIALSKTNLNETENLYHVLLNETHNNPRDFSKPVEYQKSDTRTLDRKSLQNTLTFLRPKLLEEIENTEKMQKEEIDSYYIPEANNTNIIIAALLDIIILLVLFIGQLLLLEKSNDTTTSVFFQSFIENPDSVFKVQHLYLAPSLWLLINLIFITFLASSPGQFLSGLKYSDLNGKKTTFQQRLIRFMMSLVNIVSLGLRPIMLLRKKNGMLCNISKTKITYAAFVNN